MGETKQRTCFCCGKAYHYCPHCDVDRDKPSWYFIFDSDNCRKYLMLVRDILQANAMLNKQDKNWTSVI